jgi:hypothetical protein
VTGWKGIARQVLDQAGVVDLGEQGVAIPCKDESGSVLYCKRFALDGSTWIEPAGIELTLFGREHLNGIQRDHFVVLVLEGESDRLCAIERISEWRGLPVVCVAVPGASTWRPEWTTFLTGFYRRFLIPDHDAAGVALARRFTKDMPDARVAWLPEWGQDLRGFLQGGGDLVGLLDQAEADGRFASAFTFGSRDLAEAFLARGASMGSEELRTRRRVIELLWRERVLREAAEDARARHAQALREREEVESVAEELERWAAESQTAAIGREVFG